MSIGNAGAGVVRLYGPDAPIAFTVMQSVPLFLRVKTLVDGGCGQPPTLTSEKVCGPGSTCNWPSGMGQGPPMIVPPSLIWTAVPVASPMSCPVGE